MSNTAELLTIGMITCGRPDMVYLNLRRMRAFKCRIVIADGSLTAMDASYFPSNVTYIHVPDGNFVTRMQALFTAATTPYFAFAAERRMVSWSAYEKCVQFLQHSPDFSCASGRSAYITPPDDITPAYIFDEGFDGYRQANPLQRFHACIQKYQPLFYGVLRKNIFDKKNFPPELWRLSEFYIQFMLIIHGKAAILNLLYERILPSPPRITSTLDNPIQNHLLYPLLSEQLLPHLAHKMQCSPDALRAHLDDALSLPGMMIEQQLALRSHEATMSLDDFLRLCDDDAPQDILDILNFCTANSELYLRAMNTGTASSPDVFREKEEQRIQQALASPTACQHQSPWFRPFTHHEKDLKGHV